MTLTLLHFANARLGATFTSLGSHGREHRAQQLSTFSSLADLAQLEKAQAVLISGDVFDCQVPAAATVKAVRDFFAKLRHWGIPAIILPGGRDPEGIFNPELQPDGQEICPGAWVLGPERPVVSLEEVGLVVRAVAYPSLAGAGGPATMPLAESAAMAFGLTYKPAGMPGDLPGMARAFAGSGLRYIGIGGETAFGLESEQNTVVCSPGVPEPLDWGQERGSVALVRVDEQGTVQIDRRRTGTHSFARRELAVTPENARAVSALIGRSGHPDLALEVVLTGTCPFDVMIDPAAIEAELASEFFHLRIVDRTRLLIAAEGIGALPQGTILGNFARVMEGRLRDATDDEQAAFEREAYKLGMSLLRGGSTRA